jgi:hypothetical protein
LKEKAAGLENRDYGRRGSAALTMLLPTIRKTLALTSPTSGGRSVGIVRSRTKAMELLLLLLLLLLLTYKTVSEFIATRKVLYLYSDWGRTILTGYSSV